MTALVANLDRLEEALERDGGHTVGDVLELVQAGHAQLWEAEDAVIVTEVRQEPRRKVLHFWLAAGKLDAVIKLSRDALAWGRDIGCERATLAGRRGWERVLVSEGWGVEQTLMGRGL